MSFITQIFINPINCLLPHPPACPSYWLSYSHTHIVLCISLRARPKNHAGFNTRALTRPFLPGLNPRCNPVINFQASHVLQCTTWTPLAPDSVSNPMFFAIASLLMLCVVGANIIQNPNISIYIYFLIYIYICIGCFLCVCIYCLRRANCFIKVERESNRRTRPMVFSYIYI